MPKLPETDPLIASLPDVLPVQASNGEPLFLPDIPELVSDVGSLPSFQWTVAQDVAYRSGTMFQAGGQIGLAQLASKIGLNSVTTFTSIAEVLGSDVIGEMNESMAEAAGGIFDVIGNMVDGDGVLDAGLEAGIGLAVNMACTIPVVGWIVKLAWNIGKSIRDIVEVVRNSNQKDEPVRYPATEFSSSFDHDFFNSHVLDRMRLQKDWTEMFRPPGGGVPAHAAWLGEFETQNLEGGGLRITPTNPCGKCNGYVPATAFLTQNVELFSLAIKDTGSVALPTARQHGFWLWKHISRANSPALYTVNAEQIRSSWKNYLVGLRMYIEGNEELSGAQKDALINYYNKDASGKNIYGWGKPRTHEGGVWIPDDDSEKYQPVDAAMVLKKRQMSFLDTLTVAYVGPNYGALQDPEVKAKWEMRRKQLLDHPAVCKVDLKMVPDLLYRGQVEFAADQLGQQCNLGPQAITLGNFVPPPEDQGGAAGIDDLVYLPGRPQPPRPSREKTLAMLAATVAITTAGGTAYYFRDELRRVAQSLGRRIRTR